MFRSLISLYKMNTFMMPRMMRKPAETDDPTMPPMWLYLSNLSRTAAAIAATTIDVIITILRDCQNIIFIFVGKHKR